MRLFKGKRGNWVDIIQYIGGAFSVGVIVVVSAWFLVAFNTSLLGVAANTSVIPNESLAVADKAATTFPPAYDFILPIIFVFFVVFSVWSARKIPSTHLLVWFYPFIALLLLFISLVIESGWDQFIINNAWDSVRDVFNVTDFFLSYLRFFVLAYSVLVGWALYAKD